MSLCTVLFDPSCKFCLEVALLVQFGNYSSCIHHMVAIMAYDDSVFWFMESSFPLYCKGQLISLSPGWRPFIMPADTNLLPVVRVYSRKWAQQTGCVWGGGGARLEVLLCGIPRFPSVRNSRSAHTPGRIRDEGECTEIPPEAIPISG